MRSAWARSAWVRRAQVLQGCPGETAELGAGALAAVGPFIGLGPAETAGALPTEVTAGAAHFRHPQQYRLTECSVDGSLSVSCGGTKTTSSAAPGTRRLRQLQCGIGEASLPAPCAERRKRSPRVRGTAAAAWRLFVARPRFRLRARQVTSRGGGVTKPLSCCVLRPKAAKAFNDLVTTRSRKSYVVLNRGCRSSEAQTLAVDCRSINAT